MICLVICDENSKNQAPNFKQVSMTEITIFKTEDRDIAGFRSFEFDILDLFGICHLMLGAFQQKDYMECKQIQMDISFYVMECL